MDLADRLACMELVQAWALYRDQGRWPELLNTFHPDGTIAVTWFSGRFTEFVARSQKAAQAALTAKSSSKHLIGWPIVTLAGDRAIAETNVSILGRQILAGVQVDNVSYGRFLDRLERRDGVWRILQRVAIYEKDRLDPVIPGPAFDRLMAETDFSPYPEPYRFLAYRLVSAGRTLASPILCHGSDDTQALYRRYQEWLRTGDDCPPNGRPQDADGH